MKLIVGLGNPGKIYEGSRHNIGAAVVKNLAKIYGITLKRDKSVLSLTGKGSIEGHDAALALPLTFMNLSGSAVKPLAARYGIDPARDLLVVCDDLDLEFGRLRIRPAGSSGGHKGLKSIMSAFGSQSFCRLRVGIGRPSERNPDAADYVLSRFNRHERARLKDIIAEATDCLSIWITTGVTETMNTFNKKKEK